MTKNCKKIKNCITMMMLLAMMGVSSVTIAKANGNAVDFSLSTEAYYGDDYDISPFARKETGDSVEVAIESSTGGLDYRVMGSDSLEGSSYSDCSNGYTYRISEPTIQYMYSWVYEWGYDYAGLRVHAVNDTLTAHSGWFIPR